MAYYCEICEKKTNAKRHIGLGTLIGVLLSFGWWILFIPFYKKRCVFCKSDQLKKVK